MIPGDEGIHRVFASAVGRNSLADSGAESRPKCHMIPERESLHAEAAALQPGGEGFNLRAFTGAVDSRKRDEKRAGELNLRSGLISHLWIRV